MTPGISHGSSYRRWWLALFAVLAAGLVAAGVAYFQHDAAGFRREAERQLATIATLKANELAAWRRERLSDARFFQNNLALARLVGTLLSPRRSADVEAELRSWFSDTQRSHGYDVFILDVEGTVRLALSDVQPPLEDPVSRRARGAVASGQAEMVDFYESPHADGMRLAVVMPLRAVDPGGAPTGVLVWRLDPTRHVYPTLLRWPTNTATAELLLVRPAADGATLLPPSPQPTTTADAAPLVLTDVQLPAVRAARGEQGVVEAVARDGREVLAAMTSVPDTTWALVAQIDRAEALAPIRQRLWGTVTVIGALVLAAGAVIALLWRQQAAAHYRSQLATQTQLRQQAEALREADQLLRFHVENSPLAVVEWDITFRVLRWSSRAEEIFGWRAAEVLGRHPADWGFVHPDDEASVERIIGDLVAGRAPRNQHANRNISRDGRTLHCEWYNSICLDGVGGRSTILSLALDVSDRVRAEHELRALNDDLEQRVRQRTAELETKNRDLEVFTYSVSHDLKAPLRGIEGYSRLLADDHAAALDAEARQFLANIRGAAANMARLIDDLLVYSRVERRPTHLSPVSLSALADGLLRDRSLELRQRGVTVTQRLPDEPVVADAQALSMALGNLIDNAVKFADASPAPVIEIGGETDAQQVHVWVRDNGIGFDMKYSDRIFEIFQRLHRAEDYAGTGIGLAIVRKSMERMGGRARAESRPGEGATFHLEWPA